MPFKTKEEMFGDGGGFGPAVPFSTTNPPGTSAGNRGVQFGEQLTAAIANRTHYALALNDEDLNTRLAAFEVGGLDAAYDNGAVGPSGGGRVITKDSGAVQTDSSLAAQYTEDITNAHFRANHFGDVVRGGGGYESTGFARSGVAPLFGFLDRRALNFAGYTVVSDTIAATISGSTITIGAGQFRDGSANTHLLLGYDLIEILSGPHAGVYVVASLTSGVAASVLQLDGTVPVFAAGSPTVRVFRAMFGSFGRYGHVGTHSLSTTIVTGAPGYESAVDFVPGSTLGRFDTASASPDGARYAFRVRWKQLNGTVDTRLTVDSQGQLRSHVSRSQLTTAQRVASADLGAPAMVIDQDDPGGTVESQVGYMARSYGTLARWFGVATFGDARPPTTPTGSFAFNFINNPPYHVDMTDVVHTDWGVQPGLTLFEILTPTAQAGVYMVSQRDPNTGEITLVDLDGQAVTLPAAGAGTARILYGVTAGRRNYDVGTSALSGFASAGSASLVAESPRQVGGTALLLECNNQNATPTEFHLIRSMVSEDGSLAEVFAVNSLGHVYGRSIISNEFLYRTPATRSVFIPAWAGMSVRSQNSANVPWYSSVVSVSPTQGYLLTSREDFARLAFSLNAFLPHGAVISEIHAIVAPGAARAPGNRMALFYFKGTKADVAANAIPTYSGPLEDAEAAGIEEDAGTTAWQQISITGLSETLSNLLSGTAVSDITVMVLAGDDAGTNSDDIYGIRVVYTDPGPRNY